jgi:transcription-repair coupling factor (superfamily II helicase)
MTATLSATATAAENLRQLPDALRRYEGFAEATAALAKGQPATFDGVWGSSCALLAAALFQAGKRPLLIASAHDREADDLVADLPLFGVSQAEVFPAWDPTSEERGLRDENYGERIRLLKKLALHATASEPALFAASVASLMQPVPSAELIRNSTRTIRRGERIDIDALLKWFAESGFHPTSAVELPGEFSHRGGILDIYAPDWLEPVRLELFDDEIESLRSFDVATQRSLEVLEQIEVTVLPKDQPFTAHLADHFPANAWALLIEPQQLSDEAKNVLTRAADTAVFHSVQSVLASVSRLGVATTAHLSPGTYGANCHLPIESVERFSGDLQRVRDELDHVAVDNRVYLIVATDAETERLRELLRETKLMATGRLHFVIGSLREGFRLPRDQTLIITGGELFHRGELRRIPRRHLGKAIDSFLDLRDGDLVVHLAHGIGRYRGLKQISKNGQAEEHLEIEFDGGTRIYVPAIKIDLVQKYVGGTKTRPTLAKIGGKTWIKQKEAAEEAVKDLAVEMLEVQAMRSSRPGIAFTVDSEWQREFDASFPYRETVDQLSAIRAIKGDMQKPRPMDRLLCGDVGFGKTEVAMRAAFKAVDNGYQVAVLVPTTILCEQHYHSFCERMAEFPFDIGKLSRFCTAQETRETVKGIKSGKVDIVIGTHRIASKDIEFHNLGLVVIDEEQRFGVDVKERLKLLRATVDVLTLSATPIPRTLHMSLVGVRDISNLESPPEDRVAVETRVTRWDNDLIKHAINRELAREGQVYFVHNRVNDIEQIATRINNIVPEARIRIGHAQMGDDELEQVMIDFVAHKFDILVATTIVESGLDIPNANTIFIDEADRYGLADLHQLRGRVGRYKHRAYCYLLTDPNKHITPNASRRLRAIEEFSEMGAGFAISMRDLEIRGAGNLLGTQQSGHIATVGYELYCQLLENAVRALQNSTPRLKLDVDINLPGEAYLPDEYVPDIRLKIDLYRRLTRINTYQELADLRAEFVDRFGPPPRPVERLMELIELRMDAALWFISAIFREDKFLVLQYRDRSRIEQLARQHKGQLRIVDDKSAYLPLPAQNLTPDQMFALVKSIVAGPAKR